jgi:hypothetical protein
LLFSAPTIRRLVRRNLRIAIQPARLASSVTAIGAIAVVGLRVIDSDVLPTSGSVDVAHHLALTEWILHHGALPVHPTSNLVEMTYYPFGVHLLTAATVRITTISPLQAMTVVSVGLLALTASALVVAGARITSLVTGRPPSTLTWGISLLSVLGLLTASSYSFEMFCSDFFFGQIFGLYLVVVALMFVVDHDTGDPHAPRHAVLAGVALVFAYPLFMPAYLALMLPTIPDLARRAGWRSAARYTVVAAATLGVAVALFLPGRLTTGVEILDNNGAIGTVELAGLGGIGTMTLASLGVLSCGIGIAKRRWLAATVPLGIAMALLECGAIQWLQSSVAGSQYQAIKLVYVALYLGFAATPAAIGALWSAVRSRLTWLRQLDDAWWATAILCVGLIFLAAVDTDFHREPASVDPSDYSLAVWAQSHLDTQEIDELSPGAGAYIIWVGILGRPRSILAAYFLTGQCDHLDDWIDSRAPYFLASSSAQLDEIRSAGVPYTVVHRIGQSVLIHRQGLTGHPVKVASTCTLD